jgi:polyphosphate kinase
VELLFPVEQQALRDKAWQVLKMQWKDNVKARKLESDGTYYPVSGGDAKPFNNQEELMRLYGEERKG